jgi:hypothetical protein
VRQLDVHGKKWTFTGVFDGTLLWRRPRSFFLLKI